MTEIQINICSETAQVTRALQLKQVAPKPTRVWLFDSPTLDLHRAGLRLRLRDDGKHIEMTLKVAGQNCAKIDPALLKPRGKCEADLHGDSFDDVVSITHQLDPGATAALLAPEAERGAPLTAALALALDANQRAFLAAHRPAAWGDAPLPTGIARLGPSAVRAFRSSAVPFVVEVWTLPGGQQSVELSEKIRREAALARRAVIEKQISSAGVVICADQGSQAENKLKTLTR